MTGHPELIQQRLAALARVIRAAQERYVARGEASGLLRLPGLTEAERVALAGLLPGFVKTRPGETLSLPLAALDKALQERGIATGLPEAIAAFAGAPVQTRAQHQALLEQRWEALMQHLTGLATAGGPRSAAWLGTLVRREGSAFPVVQREFNQEERAGESRHQRLRKAVEAVATALDHLPGYTGSGTRLPVFAREIAGDPHAFDEQPLPGRLLIRALTDQFGPNCGIGEPPAGALERGILLSAAGLLTDGVSSTIACFGIATARRADGSPDRQVEAAAGDGAVLIASLRQVSRWSVLDLPGCVLYAVENPSVFEDLVDVLAAGESGGAALVCTSGFLSVAAIRVLDLAVSQGARLAYGGDFDLKGLTIAAGLLRRYGSQFSLWGMGPDEYRLAAQHPLAEDLSPADLAKLAVLSAVPGLAPLVRSMQKTGKRAYQEALIPLLKEAIG